MKIIGKQTTNPTEEQLRKSLWVRNGVEVFVPTKMTGRWNLVEIGDPNNGYTGTGQGWSSVESMWTVLGDQFSSLIPLDTLELHSDDIINV